MSYMGPVRYSLYFLTVPEPGLEQFPSAMWRSTRAAVASGALGKRGMDFMDGIENSLGFKRRTGQTGDKDLP